MSNVSERPILFSGPLVRAILEGRKTVTRRVVKPSKNSKTAWWYDAGINWPIDQGTGERLKCPYGRPGDLLYVRETWKPGAWREDGRIAIDYKASPELTNTPWLEIPDDYNGEKFEDLWIKWTDELMAAGCVADEDGMYRWEPGQSPLKWRPSIHMPKWASRLWLRVTDVRVERLQDIDNHQSWAEGIPEYSKTNPLWANATPRNPERYFDGEYITEARDVFAHLWDSINAKRGYSWDSNPFVWVVEFEKADDR